MLNLKKLIPLSALLCMMVPIVASAATTSASPNNARAPYASQIKQESQTIKTNGQTNKILRDAIKDKTQQIKTIIKEDRANRALKNLKDAVKKEQTVIKQDREDLKAINTNLKASRDKVKIDRTNKDYASLVTDLNAIPSLQTSKTPILQRLSADLDTMLNILKGETTVGQ
jgi:hypothetical protein